MTDLEWLRSEFERCWPWLEPVIARYGPTHDKSHIWRPLSRAKRNCTSPNAAALTELKNYKTGFSGSEWLVVRRRSRRDQANH